MRRARNDRIEAFEGSDDNQEDELDEMLHDMRAADHVDADDNETLSDCNELYDAVKAAEDPIASGITSMSKLSFLLKLFQMKVMNRVTAKLMSKVLEFIGDLLNNPA